MAKRKLIGFFVFVAASFFARSGAALDKRIQDFEFQVSALKNQVGTACKGVQGVDEVRSETVAFAAHQTSELARTMAFFNSKIQTFMMERQKLLDKAREKVASLATTLEKMRTPLDIEVITKQLEQAKAEAHTLESAEPENDFKAMMDLSTEIAAIQKNAGWCLYLASGGKGIPSESEEATEHQRRENTEVVESAFPTPPKSSAGSTNSANSRVHEDYK